MATSENQLLTHTGSVERVFLEAKSKEELIDIIFKLKERLSNVERS